jgi:hypothetical protein
MPELTYAQLAGKVIALAKTITKDGEAIQALAHNIDEEAADTARVADSIGAMRVDTATIGETQELSKIMAGISEAAIAYAAAGNTTVKAAHAAQDQNKASHYNIGEAAARSPVGSAIYHVNRDWFRQE